MKIHIVQKGDTLWEISQQYGVDFEQVKEMNPQLSSPDMIMPGMKIKIPGTSKTVKNESTAPKEMKMPKAEHPYKDTSPEPKPVMEKEEKKPEKKMEKKPEEMKMPEMPMQPMPQMPVMDQDLINYTMINFPQMQQSPQPTKPHMNHKMQMPPQPMPMQMIPVCCHCHKPCCAPPPPPPMHHGMQHGPKKGDCGCGGPKPPHFRQMEPFEPPMEREMPVRPKDNPYMTQPGFYGVPFTSSDGRFDTNINQHANSGNFAEDIAADLDHTPAPEPPDFGTEPAYNFREDSNEPED
ncbi:SafA/ExsA family spore coat assembly protein [Virgibacillus siamensis]|uniref:SafA/ExsA family spore coat assembly protein n=1 Tax=Virgibacillus siamensis TaxID=480071 RepID=UPI0011159A8C|nr:SafA/ExsA family spore coat assembly protein [Virgibacillus siamensis]